MHATPVVVTPHEFNVTPSRDVKDATSPATLRYTRLTEPPARGVGSLVVERGHISRFATANGRVLGVEGRSSPILFV